MCIVDMEEQLEDLKGSLELKRTMLREKDKEIAELTEGKEELRQQHTGASIYIHIMHAIFALL